jgi:hypothetical protein
MHSTLRCPDCIYLDEELPTRMSVKGLHVTGVGIAGAPGIVVGSNLQIAFGVTISYVDMEVRMEVTLCSVNFASQALALCALFTLCFMCACVCVSCFYTRASLLGLVRGNILGHGGDAVCA